MEYRMIKVEMWQDPFFEDLTPQGKLLFVYLISNADNLGVVLFSHKRIAFDTGITCEEIETQLGIMEKNKKILRDGNSIYLCNFVKNQCKLNPSIVACRQKELQEIKSLKIREAILQDYPEFYTGTGWGQGANRVPTGCGQGVGIEEREKRREEREKSKEREEERREEIEAPLVALDGQPPLLLDDPFGGTPLCPQKEIVALYHEILPELVKVKKWEGERPKLLRKRWQDDPERQNLEWWKGFFFKVKASDFLCGRSKDTHFNLEWLLKLSNFNNVLEGKYDNRQAQTPDFSEVEKRLREKYSL